MEVPQNIKIRPLCDPVIPVLGICLKEYKLNKRDTFIAMLIETLFTTAKLWNQHRCPTTNM
jgi:hypothetical protein